MLINKSSSLIGDEEMVIEAGKLARQADGAVTVTYGDTVVLVTCVYNPEEKEDEEFLPLIVDYLEQTFAAGKIPGGFYKREGRPTEKEVLSCRLIDRSIRPLFPKGYRYDTQIIATVLQVDQENDPDVIAINGASSALMLSKIPFMGPLAAVRIGKADGKFILNPTFAEREASSFDIVVAGTKNSLIMVEGMLKLVPEEEVLEALNLAQESIKDILEIQNSLIIKYNPLKIEVEEPHYEENLLSAIENRLNDGLLEAISKREKKERRDALNGLYKNICEDLKEGREDMEPIILSLIEDKATQMVRNMILKEGRRIDMRTPLEIRPISCEVGILPRTHGSSLFTRGETQAVVVTTLGTSQDEQKIEALEGESFKKFMLHYNFPPFSVGEVRFLRAPSRREVGHGALAEKALKAILPDDTEFPYTIRVVSDILESNGSSSMATICGAALSLMDAGVPVKEPVAGIAMGLILEGDKVCILSDILGDEDHLGNMDFKVAGGFNGITALQMDIKGEGVTGDMISQALYQAKEGRTFILEKMMETLPNSREKLSPYAPRILSLQINPEKIRDVIGPGGRVIRGIVESTGAKIEVDDNGLVNIFSVNEEAGKKALEIVKGLTQEAEIGRVYTGKVKKITDFGAFVEILPGIDGLVHISQLSDTRVNKVSDVVKEGDEIIVKVLEIDQQGRIRLSRKAVMGKVTSRYRNRYRDTKDHYR